MVFCLPHVTGADDRLAADAAAHARMDQTFQLVAGLAYAAYEVHFHDEPAKAAVVAYYRGLWSARQFDRRAAEQFFQRCVALAEASDHAARSRVWLDAFQSKGAGSGPADERAYAAALAGKAPGLPPIAPQEVPGSGRTTDRALPRTHLAAATARAGTRDTLKSAATQLTSAPTEILRRTGSGERATADCPLYHPDLIWVQGKTIESELSTSPPAVAAADREATAELLAAAHRRVRELRAAPENRELSLRRFLERYRSDVWKLGWLYRGRAIAWDGAGQPGEARAALVRAWTIGESLFPAAERGRLGSFDPVFLAELGDVYARLGRYDLMLRYIYCDDGLPARYAAAAPVAELTRVVEAVRLARPDAELAAMRDQDLPETLGQILFDEPVVDEPAASIADTAPEAGTRGKSALAWCVVASGAVLCAIAGWRLLASRAPQPPRV